MSKSNQVWLVSKNGRVMEVVSSRTKAIAELRNLAQAPEAESVISEKDGTIALKDVLRFRARQVEVK